MNRPSSSCLLASALTAGMLLSTAGCGDGGGGFGRTDVSASALAEEAPASPTVSAGPTLSEAQARTAVITNADLPSEWGETQGAATWRDGLLKSKVDASAFITDKGNAADCQQLLDGLYAEDLLGPPKGAQAVTGFDDSNNDAQLRYQVATYGRAELDAKLAWLKTLPTKCDQFTAVDSKGGRQTVQVVASELPGAGDARQGLQMTVNGELDGTPMTLSLDYAAVRIGDSALSLTNGGLAGVDVNSTHQAVRAGAQRLSDVLAGKTPPDTPTPG